MSNPISRVVGLLAMAICCANGASAQQIWSGYTFAFSKPNFADWTLAANQDRITDQTWLTRADTLGLFNIRTETGYANITSSPSPANTEWAYDSPFSAGPNDGRLIAATNFENLEFELWRDSLGGAGALLSGILGTPGVLHLINEDIYIDVMVTAWTSPSGGGFSYVRAVPEPTSSGLAIAALGAVVGLHRLHRRR